MDETAARILIIVSIFQSSSLMPKEIGIIGAGGWGTALAKVLADKGERVVLWCHGEDSYRDITDARENRSYLPGIILPADVRATRSLDETVKEKFLVICALPSHVVRQVLSQLKAEPAGAIFLLTTAA